MFGHHSQLQSETMFGALLGRELRGGAVHRRPFVAEFSCEGTCSGTITNNPGLTGTPAFTAEYSKVYNDCKLLAIADEEGYVSIVDTGCELPSEMADDWGPNKPRAQWLAHRNAVFDLAWCNGDSHMLTASGDQTISLWDTGHADHLGVFRGHTGSVKAICPMPSEHAVFASGARDGALMVWDARAPGQNDAVSGDVVHSPVLTIQDAHALNDKQKRRRTPLQGRTRPSVTALTFLQGNGSQLATGGVDGIVKFWDLRQAAAGATGEAAPAFDLARLCDASVPQISQKQHGITSLALHPQGNQLLVSLIGGHHFIYDPLRPEIGPTRWFGGHTVASFYVKAAWSPDGTHIISGSTDRNVYIWEVDAPDGASPYVLPGHQGEVTAVAWCPADFHQIATTADDSTVKIWNIQRQQPEERADTGVTGAGAAAAAARQPWVYPWQQQRQVQAAAHAAVAGAAAAAACAEAPPGSATPGPGPAAAAATGGGVQPPWAPSQLGGSSSSAGMLAALRSPPPATAAGAAAAAVAGTAQQEQQQQQADENSHANVHRQQQPEAPPAAAGGGDAVRQQQHATVAAAAAPAGAMSAPPASGRLQPFTTPFASAGARGSPASDTAGAGARTARTAGTSGRMVVRRIGDLLDPAPSTQRVKQQKSIFSFFPSPAPSAGAGGRGAAGGKSTGGRGGGGSSRRRDLPEGGGTSSRRAAGGSPAAGGKRRLPPLPGLGGSGLPDQPSKRLRTTFEPPASPPAAELAAAAAGPAGQQPGKGADGSAAASCFGSLVGSGGDGGVAAAGGAQLEPSPEQAAAAKWVAAAAGGGKLLQAGPALLMQRQGSVNENGGSNF